MVSLVIYGQSLTSNYSYMKRYERVANLVLIGLRALLLGLLHCGLTHVDMLSVYETINLHAVKYLSRV